MHTLVLTIHNGVGVGVRWVGVTQLMEGSRQVSGNLLFQYFCKQIQKNRNIKLPETYPVSKSKLYKDLCLSPDHLLDMCKTWNAMVQQLSG